MARNEEAVGKLAEMTEQLASSVVVADAGDLRALAELHSQWQAIGRAAQDRDDEPATGEAATVMKITETSAAMAKLLEQAVLGEADAEQSLRSAAAAIEELRALIDPAASKAGPARRENVADAEPDGNVHDALAQATCDTAATDEGAVAAPITTTPTAAASAGAVPDAAPVVIAPDDVTLVGEFITEARGHLESAEAEVLRLEEDPKNPEILNAIFRAFHTIKGVAGFLNLRQIGQLSHTLESLLDLARQGKLALEGSRIDLVLESADRMRSLIGLLGTAIDRGAAIAEDSALEDLLARVRASARAEATAGGEASTGGEALTAGEAQTAGEVPMGGDTPTVQNRACSVSATAGGTGATAEVAGATAGTNSDLGSSNPGALAGALRTGESAASARGDGTVKVATDRLDSLIDMVGELVIAESMVRQGLGVLGGENQRLARNVAHMGKLTRELQELSMAMRMVPIQGVFQKMARLVRDLGRKFSRQIELELSGGETELDRNVVEAIGDPLIHMVRNSIDHGIEPAEERIKSGKPAAGRLGLRAWHQAGNIVIEIRDDGRGLNKEKIVRKAIAAGIVREGQELTDSEIFRLIFHAGLSTAEELSDVSGRGVGMDVVKRNVEALRGTIEIASTPGAGSTFTIRLPLTLAVIDGLAVRVGSERYIVPITSIDQSIQPKSGQVSTVQGRGELCLVRGRLHRLFAVAPLHEDPAEALVVIVQDNQRFCCLLVDELLGQQQVVIKSLGEGIGNVAGVSGGAILGDGNVSLILDVPGLIDLGGEATSAAADPPPT